MLCVYMYSYGTLLFLHMLLLMQLRLPSPFRVFTVVRGLSEDRINGRMRKEWR
jgi:hypothetical protein